MKEAKRTEVRGYCNVSAYMEFGIWSSELTIRRKPKKNDIHVIIKTEPVLAYNLVDKDDEDKENET